MFVHLASARLKQYLLLASLLGYARLNEHGFRREQFTFVRDLSDLVNQRG